MKVVGNGVTNAMVNAGGGWVPENSKNPLFTIIFLFFC